MSDTNFPKPKLRDEFWGIFEIRDHDKNYRYDRLIDSVANGEINTELRLIPFFDDLS